LAQQPLANFKKQYMIHPFFALTTPTTLSLQARDWHYLGSIIKGVDTYENLGFALKVKFQVEAPPTGTTLVEVAAEPLGTILLLFQQAHDREGKEVGKPTVNRFRAVLVALGTQEITDFFTAFDAMNTASENIRQEIGRKYLRGKLG
jgi:hypothetical protein